MPSTIETLIEQVRAVLIQTEDSKPKHEIYNQFVNEAKAINLTEDDFYKKILKVAHKSIDWNFIELGRQQKEFEKTEKEEKEKAIELELEDLKKNIKHAPKFIDRLVKTAFDDNVVEKDELIRIFDKAERLSQDTYELAEKISALFEDKNFKAYPKANYDLPSLRLTLCSTNWHHNDRYIKLTTPPPAPFPLRMLVTAALLIIVVVGAFIYHFYLKPKWEDAAAPRYYTAAEDAILRSSKVSGVGSNKIGSLAYGTELITYNNSGEWCEIKTRLKDGYKKGYVATQLILNKKDFFILNSIFGDIESKSNIETIKCRLALLQYFKSKNYIGKMDTSLQRDIFGEIQTNLEIWQVFTKAKSIIPNTVYFPPKIVNPGSKYSDFAVIIKNTTSNKRKLLLFSFDDTGIPKFEYEEPAPDIGDIKKISKINGRFQVVYSNGNSSSYIDENENNSNNSYVIEEKNTTTDLKSSFDQNIIIIIISFSIKIGMSLKICMHHN